MVEEGESVSGRDFRRDVTVVLKHYRFILALLVGAIIVALLTGLMNDSEFTARRELQFKTNNAALLLSRSDLSPKLDTLENLATSDELAQEVADRLGGGEQPPQILSRISIRSVKGIPADPRDRIIIRARGTSRDTALALVNTWADRLAEKASVMAVDPEALKRLQETEKMAQERLAKTDSSAARELASVTEGLSAQRTQLFVLRTEIASLDQALAFIDAHPGATPDELRVAVSSLLANLDQLSFASAKELSGSLRLRRDFLTALIPEMESEIESLEQREEALTAEAGDRKAAEATLDAAQQALATAELLAANTEAGLEVTAGAALVSGGMSWLARFGAAVAFGLVAGVAGAFALEYLLPAVNSWWSKTGWASRPKG
jgi:uncharacterized protein involved in exopolysaccharide biosynthesis